MLQVARTHVEEAWVAYVNEAWVTQLVAALFRLAKDHATATSTGGPVIRQDPSVPRLAERCVT